MLGLPNEAQLDDGLTVGGKTSLEALGKAKEAGITTIINLRMPHEPGVTEERSQVEGLGLRYIEIPISGADDLTVANAQQLDEALKAAGPEKVLLHCGSSNRVGALLAVRAAHILGMSPSEALALGKKAGLKDLEAETIKRLTAERS